LLSVEEIVKAVDDILKEYYLSIGYISVAFKQVFKGRGPDEAKRLWRSARTFLGYIGGRG
jgi:hypothetical protein